MTDPLFSLKHNFYVGNYAIAITMAESYLAKHASSAHTLFAKAYRARATIAMGKASSFLKEMKEDTEEAPELLELCMLLARTYAPQASSSSILATMEESFDMTTSPSSCRAVAATIYFRLNDRANALKCLRHAGGDIEQLALQCQIHLSSNRLDLANRTYSFGITCEKKKKTKN